MPRNLFEILVHSIDSFNSIQLLKKQKEEKRSTIELKCPFFVKSYDKHTHLILPQKKRKPVKFVFVVES